ncbi:MAG: apolipoprotein N-acyltransferase [Tepidisphaerales bacterium]
MISARRVMVIAVLAFATFHSTWALTHGWPCMTLCLGCLAILTRVSSKRVAVYGGLALGLAFYGPQLGFFWNIFGAAAILLWLVLAFWIAVFLLLGNLAWRATPPAVAILLMPFLWTATEYFRGELYYLKFTWLSAGYSGCPQPWLATLGVYGVGFVMMAIASCLVGPVVRLRYVGVGACAVIGCVLWLVPTGPAKPADAAPTLRAAGVQLEFPNESGVAAALERLIAKEPGAQLLVMSEYTFRDPPPQLVRDICRRHGKYLIAGGKRRLPDGRYYNTAFVVGPDGNIVFEQAKSVPVQFFDDGLPAAGRRVWQSPWGPIGICICYDLSYRRVVDDLVAQGARMLVVPTMDAEYWGEYEHRNLHARIAPTRAAEYGIPVVRVCSSGVSQIVDDRGRVIASGGYPGQGETLAGDIWMKGAGRIPLDRHLAWVCLAVALGMLVYTRVKRRRLAQ